jgi:integrase
MRGVPLQAVQQLLGHARIDETMRYAHLSPGAKRDAVSRLDDLGAPPVGQSMGSANAWHEQVGER